MVGEPYGRLRYCGSNDLGILTPNGDDWDIETVVTMSNEAAADNSPEIAEAAEASDAGFAVGFYSTMAFDNDGGIGLVYRDIHDGGLQADDVSRADVEMAWKQDGRWTNIMVNQGIGGGQHTEYFRHPKPASSHYSTPEEKSVGGESVLGLWLGAQAIKEELGENQAVPWQGDQT